MHAPMFSLGRRQTLGAGLLAGLLGPARSAWALGQGGLTPVGAQAAGNASGSIPAWTGGLRSPLGWSPQQGWVDPFADEKPLHRLSQTSLGPYAEQLSTGLQALLLRNKAFSVYPSHRTASYPDAVLARSPASVLAGAGAGVAYPVPANGLQAISNHLLRYLGGGVEREFDSFVVRPKGQAARIGFHDLRIYDENFDESMPGRLFSYRGYFLSPADLLGTVYLLHEPQPLSGQERKAWIYNAGQRRVRRAPDLAFDSVQNGADGLAVVDQYDGYNGSPERYDWQLLGKRELLVPYNNYRIGDKRLPASELAQPGSPPAELLRLELHRVWVVQAQLKPGQTHVYARRVFYLDEDSWAVLCSEAWDGRGQLWRVGLHSLMVLPQVQVPSYRFELWFDLSNDSYVLTGLDNDYKTPWTFGVRGRMRDFNPDALRRAGH